MSLLADVQRQVDPALAPYAVADPAPGAFDGRVRDPVRAFVVEAVREGFELHYGSPRAFSAMDEDLRLLAGDALYALGLARLADGGDLHAVAELADLISRSAQAQAEGHPEAADRHWAGSVDALAR